MTEDEIIDMLFVYSVRRQLELGIKRVSIRDIQHRSNPYELLKECLPCDVWFTHVDRGMFDVRYYATTDFSTRYHYDINGTELLKFIPTPFYVVERKYFYYLTDRDYMQSVQDKINQSRLTTKMVAPQKELPISKTIWQKIKNIFHLNQAK